MFVCKYSANTSIYRFWLNGMPESRSFSRFRLSLMLLKRSLMSESAILRLLSLNVWRVFGKAVSKKDWSATVAYCPNSLFEMLIVSQE